MSICGITSRRKADELISDSSVAVNGEYVTDLGTRIEPEKDIVEVNGKIINPEVERYIILNKPRLYLTTLAEDNNKKTILELIKDIPQRVYPVGRLDYDTEGLLFLTNAGSLANKILHPRNNVPKEYIAIIGGVVDEKALRKMMNGNKLDDGFARFRIHLHWTLPYDKQEFHLFHNSCHDYHLYILIPIIHHKFFLRILISYLYSNPAVPHMRRNRI